MKHLGCNWCVLKTECDVMTYLFIHLVMSARPTPKINRERMGMSDQLLENYQLPYKGRWNTAYGIGKQLMDFRDEAKAI